MRDTVLRAAGAAFALGLLTTPAAAGSSTPGVDARQDRQERRIDHGIQNGSLTPWEARTLEVGQNRVNRMENRFKADVVVTRGERVRLHQAQDRQSRKIFRKKHNHRRW